MNAHTYTPVHTVNYDSVDTLCSVFGHLDRKVVQRILDECSDDEDRAVDALASIEINRRELNRQQEVGSAETGIIRYPIRSLYTL